MSIAARPATIGPDDHGRAMALDLPHGMIVWRVARLFGRYADAHPGVIRYQAGGGECRIRMPWMASDRHPDQAVYLTPKPQGPGLWARWVPGIVVEVLSRRGEHRDLVLKREEYRQMGVSEYWVLDRYARRMHVDRRAGEGWEELILGEGEVHRTDLLPGLEARVGELLGDDGTNEEDE